MKYVIDRFEKDIAVLEDENENLINVSKLLLPANVSEGDIVIFDGENYVLDKDATERRKAEMQNRLSALFNRKPPKQ